MSAFIPSKSSPTVSLLKYLKIISIVLIEHGFERRSIPIVFHRPYDSAAVAAWQSVLLDHPPRTAFLIQPRLI